MSGFYTPYQSYHSVESGVERKPDNRIVDLSNGEVQHSFPYARYGTIASVLAVLGTVATVLLVDVARQSSQSSNSKVYTSGNSADARLSPHTQHSVFEDADTSDLRFTLKRNGYSSLTFFTDTTSDLGQILTYKALSGYGAIIEPHANMILDIFDGMLGGLAKYSYQICSSTESTCSDWVSFGDADGIITACKPYDEYTVTVNEYYGGSSESSRSAQINALCLYVRRDISQLTPSDLNSTMDAMFALWATSEVDGKSLYGEDFHSSSWFTSAHMFNAAQRDSDHIHEGQGFLFQHMKITSLFEKAMQAVDPSVSLPYWDYTSEDSVTDSFIFQPETFGSITIPDGDWEYESIPLSSAAIPNGRWAHILAHTEPTKFQDLVNSYGYMRGPWNTNPSPYVSRFMVSDPGSPTCSSYYSWLEMDAQSDFMYESSFGPHASMHGAIGGIYGCDIFNNLVDEGILDEDSVDFVCKKWTIYMKELYRANSISSISNCSLSNIDDRDGFSCGYTCSSVKKVGLVLKGLFANKVAPDDMESGGWLKWGDFVCSGEAHKVFSGDHLEAGSPSDPSFWPIHPNLERLYHAKMMSGGFSDSAWPTEAADACDKHDCYEYVDGDWSKDLYSQCCYGHYQDDQLLDFTLGDVSVGYGLTNREYQLNSDPVSKDYSLNYIYDDFLWSHCSQSFSAYYLKSASK